MAGHSKWANIKHRKAKVDAQKGNLFSKLGRELMVAARQGGANPETNFRLKVAIQKAREANMPMDNISRAIQRGAGGLEGAAYEELVYEGYGPGGAAVMLELLTDNRNRTAAEIRHLFSRYGGNLGETGCVSWMFRRKGLLMIDRADLRMEEDDLLLLALESGAEDVRTEGDTLEVLSAPEDLEKVKQSLEEAGVKLASAEITMLPQGTVKLEGEVAARMLKLMDALQDHDDVQEVYSNFDIPEGEMEKYSL